MAITKTRKSIAKRPLSEEEKAFIGGKALIELYVRVKPKRRKMLKKILLVQWCGIIKEAKKRIDKNE